MGNSGSKNNPQGPVRHASESGAFIQLLEFPGFYGHVDTLRQSKKKTFTPDLKCILGGYTFAARLAFEPNWKYEMFVIVVVSLQAGEWDNQVEWPLTKKLWANIAHPRDPEKDIWLRFYVYDDDAPEMTKRPRPCCWNKNIETGGVDLQRLEENGFIHNNKLYVNIELR